ncbi:CBS domain-containing protein [Candidatus Pacearchaeota archaeon]|nr:CBS domain-containing protein [Candidatus Pacearchaeota archaeon]
MQLKNAGLNQIIKKSITVSPKTTLLDARQILLRHRISRLIVSQNEKPVGVITEKDVVRAIYQLGGKPIESIRVDEFMSKNLISITEKDTIYDCAKLMLSNRISSIIVLKKDGSLAGIITKTDLASIFLTQASTPLQISKIMTKNVITVKPADSLLYVESVLVNNRISRVIVERKKAPVGIITHRDFIPAKMPLWIKQYADPKETEEFTLGAHPHEYKSNQLNYLLTFIAADIMTPNPVVVDVKEDVSTAALLMIRHGISGLPVVRNSLLVGIITKTDIVRAIAFDN